MLPLMGQALSGGSAAIRAGAGAEAWLMLVAAAVAPSLGASKLSSAE